MRDAESEAAFRAVALLGRLAARQRSARPGEMRPRPGACTRPARTAGDWKSTVPVSGHHNAAHNERPRLGVEGLSPRNAAWFQESRHAVHATRSPIWRPKYVQCGSFQARRAKSSTFSPCV